MKNNLNAFSFDSLLQSDNIKFDSLLRVQSQDLSKEAIKLTESVKKDAFKANQELYRSILEADGDLVQLKESYDRFYSVILDGTRKVIKSYDRSTELFSKQLTSLGLENNTAESKELLKSVENNFTDAYEFTTDGFVYTINPDVPMINEVFTSINKLFNSNFYNLNKDELINLHKILSSKWTAFLDACRGSILGLSKPVKYVDYSAECSNVYRNGGEKVKITVNKDIIDNAILIISTFNDSISKIQAEKRLIVEEYYKLLDLAAKYKNAYDITPEQVSYLGTIEKIFISSIQEISYCHLLAFNYKLEALKDRYMRAVSIVNKASILINVELEDTDKPLYEQCLVKAKDIEESIVVANNVFNDHLVDLAEDQLHMDCCIQEALAIAAGVSVEQKLIAVTEGALGKTIEWFKKMKEFITNLFAKVTNWFDKFIKSNVDYVKKYEEHLNKPTAGFSTLTMFDHKVGLDRITSGSFDIDISGDVSNLTKEQCDEMLNKIKEKLVQGYRADGDKSFADAAKEYFNGSAEEKTYTADQINIREMADVILKLPEIMNQIKRDQDNANQLFKQAEDALNKAAKDANNNAQQNNSDTADQSTKKESYHTNYLYNRSLFTELSINKDNATGPSNNAGGNNSSINNNSTITIKDGQSSEAINNLQKLYRGYATICNQYLQAKYGAAELCASDYIKIIKAHVAAYVNNA